MRAEPKKIRVSLKDRGLRFEIPQGENLYAALASRLPGFDAPCEGRGLCGACRVRLSPAPPPDAVDRRLIPGDLLPKGWRLACRHAARGKVEIGLPGTGPSGTRILPGRPLPAPDPILRLRERRGGFRVSSGGRTIADLPAAGRPTLLAAVLDIGTTNISLQLLDLSKPAVLGAAMTGNPQARYGEDVLSRIQMASRPAGLKTLRQSVIGAVNGLLEELKREAGLDGEPIYGMVVAANPAMAAIFAGVSPARAARPPYPAPPVPALLEGMAAAGLDIHPRGGVRFLPAAAGFIGGDVTAGLLHTGVLPGDGRSTFYLDLGTNGEMVLKSRRVCLAASTAAGPALEGRRISHGLRAGAGAIDSVRIEGDLSFTVIGGGKPRGLCGSGLLDLLAELVRAGLVRPDGSLLGPEEAAHYPRPKLAARLVDLGGERAFLVAGSSDGALSLTQSDIRELQLAKGAIRAGVELILDEAGLAPADVQRVIVAGTFGFHLKPESLVGAGFLPEEWLGRLEFAGNAALAGAREALLFKRRLKLAVYAAARLKVVHLAARPRFREAFLSSLRFRAGG